MIALNELHGEYVLKLAQKAHKHCGAKICPHEYHPGFAGDAKEIVVPNYFRSRVALRPGECKQTLFEG